LIIGFKRTLRRASMGLREEARRSFAWAHYIRGRQTREKNFDEKI